MTTDQDAFEDAIERRKCVRSPERFPTNEAKVIYRILTSANGFFIGTTDENGGPERVSFEYWHEKERAERALASGQWSHRDMTSSAWDWGG